MSGRRAGSYQAAMDGYCEAWKRVYGVSYALSGAERKMLQRLVASLPLDVAAELPRVFERYLQDEDPFVAQQQRHGLGWFCGRGNGVNKYRTTAPVRSVKEARGIEAGRQFINGEVEHGGKR